MSYYNKGIAVDVLGIILVFASLISTSSLSKALGIFGGICMILSYHIVRKGRLKDKEKENELQ